MRHWLPLGAIVASSVAALSPAAQSSPAQVETLVMRYANGDHAAVGAVHAESLTVNQLTQGLDAWIAAGGPELERRRVIVAAAFALDVAWTGNRTYWHEHMVVRDPDARSLSDRDSTLAWSFAQGRIAEWAVKRLPESGAVQAIERTLCLTAIGIAQDARAWRRLQTEILPLAQKRLPDEPRLRLADVVVRTNIALGTLRLVPGVIVRSDILRDEPRSTQWSHWKARLPEAIRAFEPLLADAELASEAHLRMGYFEVRLRKWPKAIRHFEASRTTAREPFVVAAADYFAGFVHEQQKQPDQAVAAYRRAVAVTPGMRNLSTRLAALLFLQNERAEAYALLEAAQKTRPAPVDLLVALDIADGRFVPQWLAAIRGALR